MKFYKKLYVSKLIHMTPFRIKYIITHRTLRSNFHVIALANNTDQLDIFHSRYLIQPYYKKHVPFIIGVAKNKEDAINLSKKIVEEVYKKTNTADVKAYFLENIK